SSMTRRSRPGSSRCRAGRPRARSRRRARSAPSDRAWPRTSSPWSAPQTARCSARYPLPSIAGGGRLGSCCPLLYRHGWSRYSTVHLVFDILTGIGVAAAVGIRPFLAALVVGLLAAAHVEIHFNGTDYSFLQRWPFLLALVVLAIVATFIE